MKGSRFVPGIAFLVAGAVLVWYVAPIIGATDLLLAIAFGFVFANVLGVPDRLMAGIGTHQYWLGAGIVLMGVSISLGALREAGLLVLLIIGLVVLATLLLVEVIARRLFDLDHHLASLLAAGSSICGVSAIVAVADAIRARESAIAYAAATILLFDAITIVVYPVLGQVLGLSSQVFGIWAGVSMFSTGPVVAVGFAHSDVAGQWATMTKLARNALIGVVVLAYVSYYARSGTASASSKTGGLLGSARTLWREFPTFVLGFLAIAVLANLGAFSTDQQAALEQTYDWLFLLAFVGLGTEIRLAQLRRTGLTPALVVLIVLCCVSVLSLALLVVVLP